MCSVFGSDLVTHLYKNENTRNSAKEALTVTVSLVIVGAMIYNQ